MLPSESYAGRAGRETAQMPLSALLLIVALSAAIGAQGGYAGRLQSVVGVLLAVAAAIALWTAPRRRSLRVLAPPLAAAAALAAWAIARGAVAGGDANGLATAALLGGIAMVVLVCGLLAPAERAALAPAAIALGLLVAVSGIVGVAWRLEPWVLQDQQLWRAASTLTYANAAGGILAPLALLSVALRVERPRAVPLVLATCVLLAGLGVTLSRGAIFALVAGLGVLALVLGWRPLARALWPCLLGAAVAFAGLVPSLPAQRPPSPALAVTGVAAGLAVALLATRLGGEHRVVLVAGVALAGALVAGALVAGTALGTPLLDSAAGPRLSLASPDRVDELRAAFRLVAERPLTGVGPGQAALVLPGEDGSVRVAQYVHNEYVQVLAELGAVGAILLAALLGATGWLLARFRRDAPSPVLWAGAAAALTAFALHSALDFLWHLPALPLTAALLFGLTISTRKEAPCSPAHGSASPSRSAPASPSPPAPSSRP